MNLIRCAQSRGWPPANWKACLSRFLSGNDMELDDLAAEFWRRPSHLLGLKVPWNVEFNDFGHTNLSLARLASFVIFI